MSFLNFFVAFLCYNFIKIFAKLLNFIISCKFYILFLQYQSYYGFKSSTLNKYYFPTQNLLSDAESNICKYNALIISDITLF